MYRKDATFNSNAIFQRETNALNIAMEQIDLLKEEQLDALARMQKEISDLEHEIPQYTDTLQQLKTDSLLQQKELARYDLLYRPEYNARLEYYNELVKLPMTPEARQIVQLITSHNYKGIVVYPNAVRWEPLQRPQHFLLEFARKGYLCFFCDGDDSFSIREVEDRMFVIQNQAHLLQALQSFHVLIINSFLLQNPWIENLPHRTLWYDVLDRVDFFSFYDRNMLAKHYQVLHEADIVTYSAQGLLEYVENRKDAVYLPNASRYEDFELVIGKKPQVPDDLMPIVKKNKKIIGYYGAIEEWFDTELVISTAKHSNVEIVLIGYCGIPKDSFPDNVHFLGQKPYLRLKDYAAYFDALIIPFIVNDLTNSVSPVKFFEYCAIGKPIISTPIAEILPYQGPGITIVQARDSVKLNSSVWEITPMAQKHLRSIAEHNQWLNRVDLIESELISRPSCLKVLANRVHDIHVSVFTATFLDFEGENYYSGGAERYLVDLHEVCAEMGLKLDIYQYGHFSWYRKYHDIDVYSLGHEALDIREHSYENIIAFNRRYLYAADEKARLNFYSAFFQAYPHAAHPSIGISHGVAWDSPSSNFTNGNQLWSVNERFIQSAGQVQKMVSVDTNTPNWFQTISYEIGQDMETIPNYVDPDVFFPVPKSNDGKIKIVYPRRLYSARGLYITLDVIDAILDKYSHVEFHFVGKGFEEDMEQIEKTIERWQGRIYCYHREPDDMHLVYKTADIVLIPTLYSEGTSLSCLEACATGNTIIATRIGGLTDIIIDGFNGLLINPDNKSLENAIVKCLENPVLMERLGKNALEVSKAFNKKNWKERWKSIIREILGSEALPGEGLAAADTKAIEFQLGPQANREKWFPEVLYCLQQGLAVFVRGNHGEEPESSFGRLQWITEETDLYFQPLIKKYS
ncbi:glycosyltransferase [Paenibacillus sepulcri]|uniref:Glycosyltransferase n=1 Tax=Paenibacillus sepulcri TaxID=359917 RepID=A0ABS7BVW5_9BACL|nr:glycosyltransferase [Paenibacillus sepulcri]